MKRIGILLYAKQEQANIDPMLRGLEALGYVDGKNVAIEYRDADGKFERLPEAADELVRLKPDVIFSFGGEQAPIVKKATATIPIVVVVSNDPVESGLVASLGRPGGNITGVTWVHDHAGRKVGRVAQGHGAFGVPRRRYVESGSYRSRVSRDATRLARVGGATAIARGAEARRF